MSGTLLARVDGMSTIWQDVRYALRGLAKTPLFTGVAVLSLALGIGANSAVFSLMDQVLLRALPIKHPEQLVLFSSPGSRRGSLQTNYDSDYAFSYPEYKEFRDHAAGFNGVVARTADFVALSWKGQTDRVYGETVSGNYFDVLGAQTELGRPLRPEDDQVPGQQPVVVLSHDLWMRRFGSDPSILNQTIDINSHPMTVVGVAREGFRGLGVGEAPALFVPMMMRGEAAPGQKSLNDIHAMFLNIFARVSSQGTAGGSANSVWRSLREREVADFKDISSSQRTKWINQLLLLTPGSKGISGAPEGLAAGMIAMMAMVGLLLLIACANVANLLIARAGGRQKEIAVRFALGASRWRIVRQLLIESVLLSMVGGAAGLLVAEWTSASLLRLVPASAQTEGLSANLDGRVLLFALALSLACGVLFGLIPALQGTNSGLAATLKDQASNVGGGFGHVRFRKLLVSSQVALSLLLLIGAGLFSRSLYNLKTVDPGFRPTSMLEFSMQPSLSGYSDERTHQLYRRVREEVGALPGVLAVSGAYSAELTGDLSLTGVAIQGYTPKQEENMTIRYNKVGPQYFSTMGVPLLAGRDFQPGDDENAPKVAIVNESFAKKYFSGGGAIGRRLSVDSDEKEWIEIVGVVRDSKHEQLREKAHSYLFVPYLQQRTPVVTFYVRTRQDPVSLAATVRAAVKRQDPNLPLYDIKTMDRQIDELLYTDRLVAFLSSAFGILATVLAAIGLYGVMAFVVVRRTREIGIRMALGARPGMVVNLVLREVLTFAVGGIIVALLAAFALARVLNSQLFSVGKFDSLVFVGATLTILLVAGLAGYLPASRAARVDPLIALRYE
jgi:predicted permease